MVPRGAEASLAAGAVLARGGIVLALTRMDRIMYDVVHLLTGWAGAGGKIAALAQLDLDFLVVVNPGSQRQVVTALRPTLLRTRVLHLAELVAMAQAASANG